MMSVLRGYPFKADHERSQLAWYIFRAHIPGLIVSFLNLIGREDSCTSEQYLQVSVLVGTYIHYIYIYKCDVYQKWVNGATLLINSGH